MKKVISQTFWNGIVRSVSISYLESAKTFWVQARLNRAENLTFPILRCAPIIAFLIGYPIICSVVLMKNRDNLHEQSMKDRIF